MEDEVEHPIIRNLYRQSSLETPLSPSIPSDSDSEDDDKKVEPAINQKLQVESVGNKLSRAPSPINELRNHYENVGIMKLKSDIKPERTLKDDSKPDDDYAIPNPVNKRKKIPAASQIQIPINTSLIEELRNRQVLGNSDKETKARVVGEQKKKPIPKPKPPSRSIFPEPTDGSPPLLPEKPRSGSSQTEIQTINPPLIDEVRDPNEKSGISNKTSTEAGLVTIPETLTENDNEPKANVDVSAESNADSVSTTIGEKYSTTRC